MTASFAVRGLRENGFAAAQPGLDPDHFTLMAAVGDNAYKGFLTAPLRTAPRPIMEGIHTTRPLP